METINLTKIINMITNDDQENIFFNSLKKGKNTIYKTHHQETKVFDEKWINTLESYFPSINNIIESPKSALKRESELVLVERVKKVDSRTIKHLSSNTKYIRKIDEKDGVIPTKLLTSHTDVHYATYENRFIKTLIERLFFFVRSRYTLIKENIESFQRTNLILNSQFPYNGDHITYNLEFDIKEDLDNKKINEYNLNLLKRVENLQKLVNGFYQSPFMKDLDKAKNVRPPFNKTSVLLKNPDYNNAYLLWLFLDSHHVLPFDLEVETTEKQLDENSLSDLERLTLINYLSLIAQDKSLNSNSKKNKKHLKGYKQIHKHQKDLLENPKYLELEGNQANEYYLNQFNELFSNRLEDHQEEVKLEETAIRRSLRDLIGISNSIYENYFDLNEDFDIFERLVRKTNPTELIKNSREKIKIAKIIREIKEVDYNDQIRMERRMIKEILEIDRYLKTSHQKDKLLTAKEIKSYLLTEQTKLKIAKYDDFLRNLLMTVKNNRSKLQEERSEALKTLRNLENKYQELEKKHIEEVTKTLTLKFEEDLKIITKKHEQMLEKTKQDFLLNEAKENNDLKAIELDINKNHNLNLTAIDIYLSEYYQEKLREYERLYDKEIKDIIKTRDKIVLDNKTKRNNKINKLLIGRENINANN